MSSLKPEDSCIRPFLPVDTKKLLSLYHAVFGKDWQRTDFTVTAAIHGTLLLVAEAEGELAGFIVCRALGEEGELITFGVDESQRRKGWGEKLFAAACAGLAKQGARRMVLEVAEDNEAALALYKSRGFTPMGRRKQYYARPGGAFCDAITLAGSLQAL